MGKAKGKWGKGKGGKVGKGGKGKGGFGEPGGSEGQEGFPGKGKGGKGKGGKGKGGKGKGSPIIILPPQPPATAAPGSCACDIPSIVTQVLADAAITALQSALDTATAQIREISEPDVFSCKRMSGYTDETTPVPYTGCDVEQPGGLVDLNTGKFTVQRDGVYRLTFTSRMSAMDGKAIRADMFVNGVLIGRSWTGLDTSDESTVLDLETTTTIDQMYELKAGDEVYVMLNAVGTMSQIQSSSNYQIFFTGEWIRALSA